MLTLVNADGSIELVHLSGPSEIQVAFEGVQLGSTDDDDGDGREEVPTELVSMNLVGTSSMGPAVLRRSPARPSLGQMEETANLQEGHLDVPPFAEAGGVDSFFDVFVELNLGGGERIVKPA